MRSTKPLLLLFCTTVPAAVLLMDGVHSNSNGALPAIPFVAYARTSTSCGGCHTPFPGGPTVFVVPTARVMSAGQQISITVSATGGTPRGPLGLAGGFVADVSAGTFAAGTTSQVARGGTWITHKDSFTAQRNWTFGYTAPTTPGRVDLWVVVNTVDGNGQNTGGDQWAWHGANSFNNFSTPVRLYVNAKAVQAVGTGCPDGNRNVGVFGAPVTPTIGQTFRLEGFGLPPAQRCLLVLGLQKVFTPVSAAILGAPGCFLNTDLSPLQLFATTSGSNTLRNRREGTGTFTLPAPIPNQIGLKGLFFRAQLWVLDQDSKNPFPVVFTNGLSMTIQ